MYVCYTQYVLYCSVYIGRGKGKRGVLNVERDFTKELYNLCKVISFMHGLCGSVSTVILGPPPSGIYCVDFVCENIHPCNHTVCALHMVTCTLTHTHAQHTHHTHTLTHTPPPLVTLPIWA